jgi:type II secretory pathway component PulF
VRVSVARLGRVLGTLLESGVVLVRALECARGVAGGEIADAAIERCLAGVRDGRPLADTLRATGAFPDDFVAMVRLGEESSRLPEMLSRVADTSERDVLTLVRGLVKLLEPMMILIMGLLVGGIVAAMMLPIFEMNLLVK